MHLAQAEEQEAAAVPGGDLGRGGRVHDGVRARGGRRHRALAPTAPPPRAARPRAAPPGENAHRLASFSEVHGHCVGRDERIYKDCANFTT